MTSLVMTIMGTDGPGLVESVAQVVADHDGNWLESRMAHLAGQFAGVLRISVAPEQTQALIAAISELESRGLRVLIEQSEHNDSPSSPLPVVMQLIGSDRPGIVRQVSHTLASKGVNVEEFHSECVNAPMSGEKIFRARADLRLPAGLSLIELRCELEQIAQDLVADITLRESDDKVTND